MINDPGPSNCQKIHPVNAGVAKPELPSFMRDGDKMTIHYQGVTFLPAGNLEPTIAVPIPKVYIVLLVEPTGGWFPDSTTSEVVAIFIKRESAANFVASKLGSGETYEIKEFEISDYEPPANVLVDAIPEYNYLEIRAQNERDFDDHIASLAEQIEARAALQELVRRTEAEQE